MKRILIIFLIAFLGISNLRGFPLRNLKKGEVINVSKFNAVNIKGEVFKDGRFKKIIFLWRHDKRLSKKTAKKFIKVCKARKIKCISVETKNTSLEKILKVIGKPPENVYFARNISIIKNWGVFTLPVTIFLDEKNKIIHAIGYEGQYITKVEKYLDYLNGKITLKELKKFFSAPVNYRRSILPDLNYILKLISDNQKDMAKKKLEELQSKIKLNNLNEFEKIKYAFVLIKFNKLKEALKVLKTVNSYNPKGKFYKAVVFYKMGKKDKALKLLKEISNIFPDKGIFYYYLGKIYKDKGDYKNAAIYFEKSLDYFNVDF